MVRCVSGLTRPAVRVHNSGYMKEKKYTFPVIADWVLIRKLFPGTESGRLYWVVNPEGRLSYPFRSWSFGRVLFEVEKLEER